MKGGLPRGRRGLSPLIATVILIAVTIVGGVLVYQYFQSSSEVLISAGETVFLRVNDIPVTVDTRLVYIEVTNGYGEPITLTDVVYYGSAGSLTPLNLNLASVVEPGGKYTVTVTVPADAVAVAVKYIVDGRELVSEPMRLG